MSVNYKFQVVSLEANQQDIVTKAYARYWASEGDVHEVKPLYVEFQNPEEGDKIPYAELTQETIKGWFEQVYGPWSSVEAELLVGLEAKKVSQASQHKPLPWQ